MGSAKWIGGFLGWVVLGPIGGLLGFWLGSAVDGYLDRTKLSEDSDQQRTTYNQQRTTHNQQKTSYNQQQSSYKRSYYTATEQRNSFLVSLLVLSAAVIKADGRTLQSELDYVKSFVRNNFGEAAVPEAMRMLEQFTRQEVNIYQVGPQIARYMNYSQRLQLFHYLVQLAMADGDFAKSEKSVLEAIGSTIGLQSADVSSIIAMFYKDTNAAYSVLEIQPGATDEEVRTAYRRMAMKNHPDKGATLGPDVQKAAAEKFRQIQEAYEAIKKERGMN